MKILMLSVDARVNERGTPTAERLAALAKQAGEIVALAPDGKGSKTGQLVRLWRRAGGALRTSKFDLITVQDTAYLALLALFLAHRARVPLEVQVHGFERFFGMREIIAKFVLHRVDKIRVVSERLQKELETRFKIHNARMYVLSVYTQINPPTPPFSKVGNGRDFVFLTVGRLVQVKNIALQLRAFARIAKAFPQARLRIIGSGPELSRLQLLTTNYQLQTRVSFEGHQTDATHFYQSADAFLLSSDAEGWGVAVVEAAAYGLPIIMTDVGCAGEFIRNGENGLVVPVGDERALASAMACIIRDAALRTRLSRAARASFLALPSREEYIQKQITEWRSVIMH